MSNLEWGPLAGWCRISLSADRSSFAAGDKVLITVVVRNASQKQVKYQPYPFAPDIDYQVVTSEGKPVEMTAYGKLMRNSAGDSSSAVETLSPGQDIVYELLLSRVYDLTIAARYRVHVARAIEVDGRAARAGSNALELTITEGE